MSHILEDIVLNQNEHLEYVNQNHFLITNYYWTSGKSLYFVLLYSPLPQRIHIEAHGFDSLAPNGSQCLDHSLCRSAPHNGSLGIEAVLE